MSAVYISHQLASSVCGSMIFIMFFLPITYPTAASLGESLFLIKSLLPALVKYTMELYLVDAKFQSK